MSSLHFFAGETVIPAFKDQPLPQVSYGLRFDEACAKGVQRLNCSRVYILGTRSVCTKTNAWKRLQEALRGSIVGSYLSISAHTPFSDLSHALENIRHIGNVDCLVTLGGGSVTDAGKIIRFAMTNSAYTVEEIGSLWGLASENPKKRGDLKEPTIPIIHIPTTLSGGEYMSLAGGTDAAHVKHPFQPSLASELIIQDPELCTHTPERLWLSSGVRAVDHCVETLCSLLSNDGADAQARNGLIQLIPGLLGCKANPADLESRHTCQRGAQDAMAAVASGVPLGGSHAIGHQLGPLGVGHGETSCVLLPAVCQYNAARGVNIDRQERCKDVFLEFDPVNELIAARGVVDPDLGDILDMFIDKLGMPRSLEEVNVSKDQYDQIATNSLGDMWIKTNPIPITEKSQVLEILEAVVSRKRASTTRAPKGRLSALFSRIRGILHL